MRCSELIEVLNQQSEESYALSWDNVGLLVGKQNWEINKIYLAVDATTEVIEEAIQWGADLILTHHPMIFSGVKKVTDSDMNGRRILTLIEHHIALYAMHTNFDILGMSELAGDYMKLQNPQIMEVECERDGRLEGIGRYGTLPEKMTLQACAELVKQQFQLEHVKVFGKLDRILETAGICTGSGEDYLELAVEKGLDVMITGDIKHHPGIDALEQGLCVIDAGHYGLEHIFTSYMKEYLEKKCPALELKEQPLRQPFHII